MKIILIGSNGKMGNEIENAVDGNDFIVEKIDQNDVIKEKQADVIIDFSTAENRNEYIAYAKMKKVPYACFSTNLTSDDEKELRILSKHVPVLHCQNSSRGMNAMFDLCNLASKELVSAEVVLTEYHHKNKKDVPSGTAKKLENILNENNANVQTKAFRVSNENGTHVLQFFMEDEVLEIVHRAKSRKIFALGAIEMARKLIKKKKGFFETI